MTAGLRQSASLKLGPAGLSVTSEARVRSCFDIHALASFTLHPAPAPLFSIDASSVSIWARTTQPAT